MSLAVSRDTQLQLKHILTQSGIMVLTNKGVPVLLFYARVNCTFEYINFNVRRKWHLLHFPAFNISLPVGSLSMFKNSSVTEKLVKH